MIVRILFFLSLHFFLIHSSDAQNILGTVKNSSGEGIAFATISVLNTSLSTVADREGRFSLNLADGDYQLAINAVGYAAKVQAYQLAGQATALNIVLENGTTALGEVVVSANKREEDILQVASSITSLPAQKVEQTRTVGLSNLTGLVPNYLYSELGVGFQQVQSIRGVQVFSENPAVATYIDDVNNLDILANGMMFTDIERIEVLRGPQGTLFGRNAMGGVVNIITKKPSNRTEGFVEAGVGNLALQRHAAGFKTPLIKDKVFLGINGLFQSREGYWKNDTTGTGSRDASLQGQTVGGEKNLYGNIFLKWLPSAKFSATLNFKGQRDWSDESGFFVSQRTSAAIKTPEKINLARIGEHERRILNSTLTLKYFGSGFTLTSISAVQRIGISFKDIDFPGFYSSFYDKELGEALPPQRVLTQELRLNGSAMSNKLQYTVGAFGFGQKGFEPSTNLAYEISAFEASGFQLPVGTPMIYRNRSNNYGFAGFGELTYAVLPKLKATAGLRYDYERPQATFNGYADAFLIDGKITNLRNDTTVNGNYSALSPKVSLAYGLNSNANLYATFTRGFRAGGVNASRLPAGVRQKFDPEYSNNFELGYKAQIWDKRLRIGLSAFLIQWQDLQFFNLVAPGTFARDNVGDAQSSGVELELSAIPVRNLQVDASIGVNQTEYDDFELKRVSFATSPPKVFSIPIGGNRLSNAPAHTLFLGAQYSAKITGKASLTLRGELRNIGKFYTDIQNAIEQPSYTLLNTNVMLDFAKFSLSFWGQNLGDTAYFAFGNPDSSFGTNVRTAAPRTFGATAKLQF